MGNQCMGRRKNPEGYPYKTTTQTKESEGKDSINSNKANIFKFHIYSKYIYKKIK